MNTKRIEHATNTLINQLLDGLGSGVEGRNWREDDCSRLGKADPLGNMEPMEGKLIDQLLHK
ncbi:hypothetical protein N7520_010201 [Penicillium odoratum]|uniref:uncharacterized protein n=1 Tax=Penicillium odoratum TaxID=1167516 RepID=UPI0025490907|nr:uncharacterized protein N7520_010201 [Penicillium odoratum]KAJ5753284.1 hypothetical protein N7520_010201 [Penicillium odoratum]